MIPRVKNVILAGPDSVALDAVAARLMGFDPLAVPYLRLCQELGLGVADPGGIELVGDDVAGVNFGFQAKRSFVIWADQMLRRGPLQPLEHRLGTKWSVGRRWPRTSITTGSGIPRWGSAASGSSWKPAGESCSLDIFFSPPGALCIVLGMWLLLR